MAGISPVEIYRQTGLKGYNLSLTAIDGNVFSSMLREIKEYQNNPLIIVDLDGFMFGENYVSERETLCYWLDTMKKGQNWLDSIEQLDPDNRIEHYFPIFRYHKGLMSVGVWKWLTDNTYDGLKGFSNYSDAQSNITEAQRNNLHVTVTDTDVATELSNNAMNTLDTFLKSCKDNEIGNVLFINMPYSSYDKEGDDNSISFSQKSNYVRKYVEKYGYKVFDYGSTNNVANLESSDFVDRRHLHIDGAIKFSTYLGEYLKNNYSIVPQEDNAWDVLVENLDSKYTVIRNSETYEV